MRHITWSADAVADYHQTIDYLLREWSEQAAITFMEEVEAVLNTHPKVQRALVESRLHPLYGEVPVARYIPSPDGAPTTMDLRNHLRTHLAAYKIPLLFSAVTELPLTASGKLKRA